MPERITITGLDYETLNNEFNLLASKLLPNWDYSNLNDPVVYLKEIYLSSISRANWFANAIANEANLLSAVERSFINSHAKSLNYTPITIQPSTATLTINVTPDNSNVRTISKYTMQVSTKRTGDVLPVFFENLNDIVIPISALQVSDIFIAGVSRADTTLSPGTPFFKYRLSTGPIIVETLYSQSLVVKINSIIWTKVNGFGNSNGSSEHYVLQVDDDGFATIFFGDGVNGKIPIKDSEIIISYRIGGGKNTNVLANTITERVIVPSYVISVNNSNNAVGGTDQESIEHIKLFAPLGLTDNGQLNRLKMIELFINNTIGVVRSFNRLVGNKVESFLITQAGFNFNTLKPAIENQVRQRLIMGYDIQVLQAKFQSVTIEVTLFIADNFSKSDIRASITNKLINLVNPLSKDNSGRFINNFGQGLKVSDIGFVLKTEEGVFDYTIDQPTTNISVLEDVIITDVGSTIIVNITGGQEVRTFFDPEQVQGAVSNVNITTWRSPQN